MIDSFVMPDSLSDDVVRLEPLDEKHVIGLKEAVCDGQLWRLPYTNVPHPDEIEASVLAAIKQQEINAQYPFSVIRLAANGHDEKIVGSTRFYEIDVPNRRLAIGYTWYAQSVQRTPINTHSKYLLLNYAFEQLNCLAVAFHTDTRNQRSRDAIQRLGATQEGVLRQHKIMRDGYCRDTVCFSILDKEWSVCKKQLENKL